MKAYKVTVVIEETTIDIQDPVTELLIPTIGFKVNLMGKEYGNVAICTDKDKLTAIPYYLKEYLENIINKK